jgi:PAS domain S-box-containing protein
MTSAGGGKVLIVEDDPGVAMLERRRLERAGYEVAMAGTAAEAMVQVRAGGVALILLDYQLPGDVDGLSFCTALRDVGFDIPVILVTGFGSEATVIKALRANVRDYVSKSVDYLDYLPGAVQRILKQVGVERQLAESEAQLAAIVGSARDAILAVGDDRRISLLNPAAERMFGRTGAEAIGMPITAFLPEGLRDAALSEGLAVRADGETFPVEVSLAATGLTDRKFSTVLVRDISERKRHETESAVDRTILEAMARGEPLPDILAGLTAGYERLFPGTLASVLLQDAEGRHLRHAAAPSLPRAYCQAIDGVEIGPRVGSCGTAAFTGRTVVVSDIANDPLWQDYRDLALGHGLRACWSVPILSSQNRVLGTFALYYRAARVAQPSEVAAVERGANMASLAMERHQVNEALRVSEERCSRALLGSNDGIWDWNISTGESYMSPRWKELLGFADHEVENRLDTFYSLLHPDDRDRIQEATRQHLEHRVPFVPEMRMRTKSGEYRWFKARGQATWNDEGTPLRVAGTLRDISEMKQAGEALRKNQDYLRTIIDNEPECVKVVAADGRLLEMNAAGLAMIEADAPEAVIGQSMYGLIAPEHREAYQALNSSVCQGQRGLLEFEIIGLRGTRRWMQTHAVPFRQEPDGPFVQLAITRDISEHRRLEAQLRQSQKMEAVGRVAGGVAHDFNNLLTVINGYSDLLLASAPADGPDHLMLEQVRKAGDRAAGLTQQLLAFSRRQVFEAKVLDLNELLANEETMLPRLIGEDVDVRLVPAPGIWPVLADPGQIQQVIMNLAVNARDAMPEGGTLTFETANIELDESTRLLHPEVKPGPYVWLSVTDTGCGMDDATIAHIFEPFFTTKGPDKGTGLGLSVVYGIVKQSGGYVYVSSEPGQGTTFNVYLPRHQGANPVRERPATVPAHPEGVETILLVEDEEGVRVLTARVLRACGYTVLEAGHGTEGLQIAAAHEERIHLLVTDVILPGLSGKHLAKQLTARSAELKVLFISGYTAAIINPHGVLDPNTNFLQKPFSPAVLAQKVRDVLDGR